MLPRVIILFAIVTLGGMLLRHLNSTTNRNTYRPRKRWSRGNVSDAATFLMPRTQLAGLRDSFSTEPIDPDRALMRCPACQSVYHADSVKTLERENNGRCISCNGTVFDHVQVVDNPD